MTLSRIETPLVAEIETLVEGVPGWSPIDELFTLSTLVYATAHLPGDVVEVGSWFGRSAIALGTAVRDTHGLVRVIGEPHQMRVERRNHPSRLDRGRDPIE